jgi:4-aminobutyrate aminotransferase-like enzyme/Ser/Thr protein kinase RdoA (MazF antagonist)
MNTDYLSIKVDEAQASKLAQELYGLSGEISTLPGELDFNFRIKSDQGSFILKVSRPDEKLDYLDFQSKILQYIQGGELDIKSPEVILDQEGKAMSTYTDQNGNLRQVRLLTWLDGRLWSSVNPIQDDLRYSLGLEAGKLTKSLMGFDHPEAHRYLEWDPSQSLWIKDFVQLFHGKEKEIVQYYLDQFEAFQDDYKSLRKSVIHNDVNDNNIVVSEDLKNPEVTAIIDFGDAIYAPTINDLGVLIAYGVMGQEDVLEASISPIKGYHKSFPIEEKELEFLYTMVALQLLITVTKSAINKEKEPDNEYLQISEKPAWEVLKKWIEIHPRFAHYHFRNACGFEAHPNRKGFDDWLASTGFKLAQLFPSLNKNRVLPVDMSVSSTWLGPEFEYTDFDLTAYKLAQLQKEDEEAIIAGGYQEFRPFYSTKAYEREGNSGPEWRTAHLGVDYWVKAETPVHALSDGIVEVIHHNNLDKDYGPTLILKHETDTGIPFYTLYGHLSLSTLNLWKVGDQVKSGDLIAYIGNETENGNWNPHLHFQLMLDLFDEKENYPGVAYPNQLATWSSICPDPNSMILSSSSTYSRSRSKDEIMTFRKSHLGKSLSISYDQPLNMVRGSGVYLINEQGQKFVDTVNNVAHVGHENERVVKAGRKQMALLNTNTRYLHQNITDFAFELLSTFPRELAVVHFVNSGSEANELAMRMAKTVTGQKDMIAVEIGYHGNSQGCIDISSYKFDGKGGKGAPEHTHIVPLPDVFRGIHQGQNQGEKYASYINKQIEKLAQQDRKPAAFICEPIISCGGQIELPEDYLKSAYKSVREAGGLCISDEVQVGMGRVGSAFWGFQLHGVVPDIVTIGKPIGNGHPLAAVICTQEVAEKFANGMEYFNTFGGNPVSCAIGKEVLAVVRDENLQQNALEVGEYLKSELERLQKSHPSIQDIRGQGLFLGFEFVDEAKNPLAEKASYLANRMKDFGILMSTDGKDHNAIKIKPPVVFSKENAQDLIARMEQVLNEDFILKA